MADKRIHDLTDTQASYDPDIYVAADDATFTNTKKMAISNIYPKTDTLDAVGDYNPNTTLLRTDNGSGSENKVTVTDLIQDTDTVSVIKTAINEKVDWETATNTYVNVESGTNLRAAKLYGTTYMSIKLDYQGAAPAEDTVIFTLSANFPVWDEEHYISLVGQSSTITVLKTKLGTREIVAGAYASTGLTFGSAAFPVIP